MNETPIQMPQIPDQEPKILSLEEFGFRDTKLNYPRYSNFFLHFLDPHYQIEEYYIKFRSEHTEMDSSLCEKMRNKVQGSKDRSEALKPFDKDLYEAYKIMRGYGVSDQDLFA